MPRQLPHSLLDYLQRWPPALVLETFRGPKRNRVAIATKRSGIPGRTFRRIAARTSWTGIKVETVDAFLRGCDFDPFHVYRKNCYLKQTVLRDRPLAHLSRRRLEVLNQRLGTLSSPSP